MKEHWEQVYATKLPNTVSWFQEHAERSLRLIRETGVPYDAAILDVGGGASVLVDDLIANGFTNLSVLDLSGAALQAAQRRLGAQAAAVRWLEADITTVQLAADAYGVWHDRAVFHFLTAPQDRAAYVQRVRQAVTLGGHVIIATFAEDGPPQCSGLPVRRYSVEALQAEFGASFALWMHEGEDHHTPFGTVQKFIYCSFRKVST